MKLSIVALGHRMPAWVDTAYNEYAKRLPREYALELVVLKPAARDTPVPRALALEAQRIEAACAGAAIVALDERGAAWTTRQLADRLAGWRNDGSRIAFVIGSADGLDATLKKKAAACIQLSALTLPHGMARVLLVEQLYRAASLIAGHPYHRE